MSCTPTSKEDTNTGTIFCLSSQFLTAFYHLPWAIPVSYQFIKSLGTVVLEWTRSAILTRSHSLLIYPTLVLPIACISYVPAILHSPLFSKTPQCFTLCLACPFVLCPICPLTLLFLSLTALHLKYLTSVIFSVGDFQWPPPRCLD